MKLNMFGRLDKSHFSSLDFLQWILPLGLAITAFVFEFVEHGLEEEVHFDLTFISEVIIFGLMGPIIIGLIIAWMRHLMAAEKQAVTEINILNRELENKIAERTAALEQRNTELDKANHELQKLDEMKSDFVSLVSHELRAPLTAINGGLEIALQSADSLPPASRRTLEAMMDESARLTEFVQTILDVSRLEAGRITLNLGPVPVAPILHRSVEVILGTRRTVKWHLPAEIPPIWADEIHYEQIFRNLLLNADKYSPPNMPIEINVHNDSHSIRVEVTDHGVGIPSDMQEKIFERFQRGQSSESAPPGWGLGLYFAKKLTEAQNGMLTLHSPSGPNPMHPAHLFPLPCPSPPARQMKVTMPEILIIDDDQNLSTLLCEFLSGQGYATRCAANGRAGLREMFEHKSDLIILDVTMPQMDGWETLKRIREVSDTPVIMLTARDDESDILRGFSQGADDYVTKPFSFAQLAARIKAVLARKGDAPAVNI